jgi:hypothetical protein
MKEQLTILNADAAVREAGNHELVPTASQQAHLRTVP